MRERFPIKRVGDPLTAAHINDLSSVARRFSRFKGGGGLNARHGDSFFSASVQPPFVQGTLFVYALPEEATPNVYSVHPRVFNHTSNLWETDEDDIYELDASEFGAKLLIGDLITAFWNDQRGAYVPCWVPTDRMAVAAVGININMSGNVTLYYADKTASTVVVTAYHTWMVGSDAISINDELQVSYKTNADGTGRYIITNAECAS